MAVDPRQNILDRIRQKMKDIESTRRRFWKTTPGTNLIRILAWLKGEPFYLESREHFIPWGGRQQRGIVLGCCSPNPCPACVYSDELKESENPDDRTLGERIQANSRYLYNIVDLKDPEAGVQIWSNFSNNILSRLLDYYVDADCGDFTDPKTGRNIEVIMTDRGKNAPPAYEVKVKMGASAIRNREWTKDVKDLRKLAARPDAKELKNLVLAAKNQDTGLTGNHESAEDIALKLPCFGLSYNKLPACPKCPVQKRCKIKYRAKRLARQQKELLHKPGGKKLKKSLGLKKLRKDDKGQLRFGWNKA